MDKLEQTVEHERQEPARLDAPEDADINHPALRPMHDKMVISHQRRMQQLANKERELDRQMQQLSAMTSMSQQQYQSAGQHQNNAADEDEFAWLDPEVKPLLSNPDAAPLRALVRSLEKRSSSRVPTEGLSSLQQTVEALSQQLQHTQQSLTQERYARQIPEFRQKYGQLLDEDMQQNVLRHALQSGADLERALFATHPEVALAQERVRMEKDIRAKYDAEFGAALEGMNDIVSSEPQAKRSPVDKNGRLVPFSATALDVLGKGGMVAAVRDGFAREETVTE